MQIRGLLLVRELDHLQQWAMDLYTYLKVMDSLVPIWFMAPLSRNSIFVSDDSPLKWSSGTNQLGKNVSANCTPNLSLYPSLHFSHACNFGNAWPSYCTCGQRSSQSSITPQVDPCFDTPGVSFRVSISAAMSIKRPYFPSPLYFH